VEQVEADAFAAARALGHSWVGGEHLLLALCGQSPVSPARQALEACGVDVERVQNLVAAVPRTATSRRGVSPNPRFYGIVGRAEGFAIATGALRPSPEHFLLALLWESKGLHTGIFRQAGATPAALQAALADRGVAAPERDEVRWGQKVPITAEEYHGNLPGDVYRLLPPGTHFGFNIVDDEPWIIAERGIDLVPYLEQARRRRPHA
jgi:ATP-dependent Clp protease ATP-binding subunit ClpA